MKSKTDNLIAAIRSLLYRYSIKSLSFDKNILFFDLTIRLYPDMQNQWRNLLRGQNALSNKSKSLIMEFPKALLIDLFLSNLTTELSLIVKED
jgi:hypothetical protein